MFDVWSSLIGQFYHQTWEGMSLTSKIIEKESFKQKLDHSFAQYQDFWARRVNFAITVHDQRRSNENLSEDKKHNWKKKPHGNKSCRSGQHWRWKIRNEWVYVWAGSCEVLVENGQASMV